MPKSKPTAPSPEGKLFKVLGDFSLQELTRFRDYIASSYLSNQTLLLELFDSLLPLLRSETSTVKKGTNILRLLITTARFGASPYSALLKDLLRLAQNYIEKRGYHQKPQKAVSDVLKAVNAKRLDKLFDINLSLAQRLQSMVSDRSADYYRRDFIIQSVQPFYEALSHSHAAATPPHQLMRDLDILYLVNKLRYACTVFQNQEQHTVLLEEVMLQASVGYYSTEPSVMVYHTIYRMLQQPDEVAHFELLKKTIKTAQRTLPEAILRDIYVYAINYCVSQINKGKLHYLRDVYDLYTTALDHNFLYDGQQLEAWDIANIMALSGQLRNYQWSDKFIQLYKERAPYSGQMNVFTFNLAKMYFFSQRYDEVLKLFANVENTNPMYLLGTHTLVIQSHYHLGDWESLHKCIAKFKAILKRRKSIDPTEREQYLHFLDSLSLIIHTPTTPKKNRQALRKTIGSDTDIAEAAWLREILQ